MHEVQGSFCKTIVLWKNAKITAAEKKHYGPNLAALLGQQRGAVGSSPMGQAQSVEEAGRGALGLLAGGAVNAGAALARCRGSRQGKLAKQ